MSSVFTKNLGELSKSNCQFCKRFQGFQERKDDLLKGWQQNALHTRTIDYGGPYFIQMHSLKYLFPSFFIVLFAPYLKNKNWIKSFAKDSKVVGGTKEIQKTLHTERFLLHTTTVFDIVPSFLFVLVLETEFPILQKIRATKDTSYREVFTSYNFILWHISFLPSLVLCHTFHTMSWKLKCQFCKRFQCDQRDKRHFIQRGFYFILWHNFDFLVAPFFAASPNLWQFPVKKGSGNSWDFRPYIECQ